MNDKKSMKSVVSRLVETLYTTEALKLISSTLEELSQDRKFKLHADAIVSDESLTDSQKKRQLNYLIKTIEVPELQTFLSDEIEKDNWWLFSVDRIDYFDRFVQNFQIATEEIGVVYLTTSIPLSPTELKTIAKDLSKTFGYKVVLRHEVNKAIVGGAQVRVENLVFDYSLRTKFQHFQKTWLQSLNKTDKLIGRNQVE